MKQAHLYKRKPRQAARALIVTAVISACLLAAFLLALKATGRQRQADQTQQLETAIRRACVTCYAIEGRYPRDLDYITEEYGVMIDRGTFLVLYDAFAENLMPSISVSYREEVGS